VCRLKNEQNFRIFNLESFFTIQMFATFSQFYNNLPASCKLGALMKLYIKDGSSVGSK